MNCSRESYILDKYNRTPDCSLPNVEIERVQTLIEYISRHTSAAPVKQTNKAEVLTLETEQF